jgi:hypothetical protein
MPGEAYPVKLISYDGVSGDLRDGVVSEAGWGYGADPERLGLIYAKYAGARNLREFPLCFRGSGHASKVEVDSIDVDLFGKVLAPLVNMVDHGFTMVTEEFAVRLRASGLTGFRIRDAVVISMNQSGVKAPRLLLFEVTGSGGFARRYRVSGAPNECPNCGRAPVICVYCGTISSKCPRCGRSVIAAGAESGPGLFTFTGHTNEPRLGRLGHLRSRRTGRRDFL